MAMKPITLDEEALTKLTLQVQAHAGALHQAQALVQNQAQALAIVQALVKNLAIADPQLGKKLEAIPLDPPPILVQADKLVALTKAQAAALIPAITQTQASAAAIVEALSPQASHSK